jgi:hypothetical protein
MELCRPGGSSSGKVLTGAIGLPHAKRRSHPRFTCHHLILRQTVHASTITGRCPELLTAWVKASRLQVHVVEQRRNQRFELRLPLRITRSGIGDAPHSALTRNISSSGVLFTSETEVQPGGTIEYVVSLNSTEDADVDLRCIGKVVRLVKSSSEPQPPSFLVAATLDRYQFIRRQS